MRIRDIATRVETTTEGKYPNVGNITPGWLFERGYEVIILAPVSAALADKQAFLWAMIKSERERRKAGGVLVNGKWFHTDTDSRIQHIGLTIMGAGIPAALLWKTMDGSFVVMTQQLAMQIFQSVAAADQQNFATAEMHRIAMEAQADPRGYDYSTGWLSIYEPVQAS